MSLSRDRAALSRSLPLRGTARRLHVDRSSNAPNVFRRKVRSTSRARAALVPPRSSDDVATTQSVFHRAFALRDLARQSRLTHSVRVRQPLSPVRSSFGCRPHQGGALQRLGLARHAPVRLAAHRRLLREMIENRFLPSSHSGASTRASWVLDEVAPRGRAELRARARAAHLAGFPWGERSSRLAFHDATAG